MPCHRRATRAVASLFLLAVASPLFAQEKDQSAGSGNGPVPQGLIAPTFRVTGVRSSPQLSTEIHCSNVDAVPVSVYVSYFEFNGTFKCSLSFVDMPVGTTRTFASGDSQAFAEDQTCPLIVIGQGRVEIGTFPANARVNCSAQVVSTTGNPPTTLSSLDVFRAN